MKVDKPLVVFDLETTGTWVKKDKIVEIGMIKLMPDGTQEKYLKRVNPGIPIPVIVTRIIGITDEDVKDAPSFKDIIEEVLAFIKDTDFGGFNIKRFDLPLLERECYEAGFTFSWKDRQIYDAQTVYHIHEKRDLTAAYKFYCDKPLDNAHSAMGDAEATAEIFKAQIAKYGDVEKGMVSLRDFDYEKNEAFYDKERKFRWWNGELYPSFGKHDNKTVKQILQQDRGYLKWMFESDFSNEVKSLIQNLFDGKFPEPPE
jgi:DNA polymerase-3 subunit epsilon